MVDNEGHSWALGCLPSIMEGSGRMAGCLVGEMSLKYSIVYFF